MVKLATDSKSLTHYTKGTQSPHEGAPTACTHTVSGSISLPSPGFFSPFPHGTGSLSVSWEYLALEDGPPIFRQDSTCPVLLIARNGQSHFGYGAITRYGRPFQDRSPMSPPDTRAGLFPFRSPLLRESRLISFPAGTEMFQFPAFASQTLCIRVRDTGLRQWVSPFGYLRFTVWLPTPRSFSQAPTSFFASSCQGIHRMRLFA